MNETKIVAEPGQRSILITRLFDAPRHLVWKAITTPELIAKWWGPHCVEMVSCAIDFRVGGSWRFLVRTMGKDEGFRGEYREIVPNEKIVQTFIYDPYPDMPAVETMTLGDRGPQTLLTVEMVHISVEARDGMLGSGMEVGMGESHRKLEELVLTLR